jgi:hypothetical protein
MDTQTLAAVLAAAGAPTLARAALGGYGPRLRDNAPGLAKRQKKRKAARAARKRNRK